MLKMIIKKHSIPCWILYLSCILLLFGCVSGSEGLKSGDSGEPAAPVEEDNPSAPLPVPRLKQEDLDEPGESIDEETSRVIPTPEPQDPVLPEDEKNAPVASAIVDTDLSAEEAEDNGNSSESNSGDNEQYASNETAAPAPKQEMSLTPRPKEPPPTSRRNGKEPVHPVKPVGNTAGEQRSTQPQNTATKPAEEELPHEDPLFAKPGDLIQYPFDTRGWVYNKTEPDNGGITFLEKRNGIENTVTFVFEAEKLGSYTLEFISYDMETGTEYVKRVPVRILEEEEFLSRFEPQDIQSGSQIGQNLYESGQYEDVVSYYNENPPQTAADAFYFAMGEKNTGVLNSAVSRLEPLLDDETYSKMALEQLSELAVALDSKDLMLRLVTEEEFFELVHPPDNLLKIGSAAVELERPGEGISVLRFLMDTYGNYDQMDRVLWLLGNLLEMPGPYRDIREAVDLYVIILDNFPTSIYYEGAEKRIAFLKRHYILIN